MSATRCLNAGIDAGSTTLKLIVTEKDEGRVCFSDYQRHHADIPTALRAMLAKAAAALGGDSLLSIVVTGSAGLGLAESSGLPFMQESIAAAAMARRYHPLTRTLVDIGGEDAKMIFFESGHAPDIRMNGSCAGGTGAFIDQIATLLNCEASSLDTLAKGANALHPVASRCGVFAKTDIQNLLSRNVSPADIAASAFQAVARQIASTLARGRDIVPPVLFCGGPLAHLGGLREACSQALGVNSADCVIPENAVLVPALGCAVATGIPRREMSINALLAWDKNQPEAHGKRSCVTSPCKTCAEQDAAVPAKNGSTGTLQPLFTSPEAHETWARSRERQLPVPAPDATKDGCWLGVDSGSTTTKIVALARDGGVIFTYYAPNNGNPLEAARTGLERFHETATAKGYADGLRVHHAAVTGYGEDLLKAAFGFDTGLVETMAHYRAARSLEPDVSFLLDIGGQDMKAVFIERNTIARLDINEACSSGCGSFIDSFARSLGMSAAEFATLACSAENPCDLGTRCTVFMNSRVKQAQRENATRSDIAAGLAYSVAKNCLFKVLKLKNTAELGGRIVVQGGTMRNHAVVRAFELLTGIDITVAPTPELMGAYGAALYALDRAANASTPAHGHGRTLASLAEARPHDVADRVCPGCENRCVVRRHTFANGNTFFAGNKCEKIFSNRGEAAYNGENLHAFKQRLLFSRCTRDKKASQPRTRIGIPRVLNFHENIPFWHALLTHAGFDITLSAPSTFGLYGSGVRSIMSDNICFPAKLVHGHILDLLEKKVDRIFMPFVINEQNTDAKSASRAYNCPIVSGYSDVIRSAIDTAGRHGTPLDSPTLTFADPVLLNKACRRYIVEMLGVSARIFDAAFDHALAARREYEETLAAKTRTILAKNATSGHPVIVLAGRPYHSDPLIQHKVADMFAAFGADVLTEDVAAAAPHPPGKTASPADSPWAYPNRIIAAAAWVAAAPANVHFVQITSFGCGPDAFILDEIGDILRHSGKSHTVLKVDDINNPGSMRLRARSLLESLDLRNLSASGITRARKNSPPFTSADRNRLILVPFFSEIYSPFIPSLMRLMGYNALVLPPADNASIDHGLQHANNEICYPATLVIGDFIRALKSGNYRHDEIALGITQTGGQCRATSYLALIKRALITAGYPNVPVVAVGTVAGAVANEQPGFSLQWRGNIRLLAESMLYADHIGQMYNATAPREKTPNGAARLRDDFVAAGAAATLRRDMDSLRELLARAVTEFNAMSREIALPRVGVVGEIYVKYNSTGNRNIVEWLIRQGVEPVVPPLTDFFLQEIPNRSYNRKAALSRRSWSDLIDPIAYQLIRYWQSRYDRIAKNFRYHRPVENVFKKAESAKRIVNLAAQYGEGWLIPAELASFAESGVNNAVSLQPFGCIANHLISKGIEKRIRELYPRMNLLFLDLDSGASEANLFNRLHFIVQNAKDEIPSQPQAVHLDFSKAV
ncbi:MAG: acyl-CoA dehydratase activase-related protein [Puniceicoccales bacterium]|jgi:predicted CoA-substrate-specific enzyme activase|nr:acyl-CoA dehydratase activase-related protein [Puniceicoccales bacterium]